MQPNQDEDSPPQRLANVFDISIAAEHDDRKGSGVVVIDERSAQSLSFLEIDGVVIEKTFLI